MQNSIQYLFPAISACAGGYTKGKASSQLLHSTVPEFDNVRKMVFMLWEVLWMSALQDKAAH